MDDERKGPNDSVPPRWRWPIRSAPPLEQSSGQGAGGRLGWWARPSRPLPTATLHGERSELSHRHRAHNGNAHHGASVRRTAPHATARTEREVTGQMERHDREIRPTARLSGLEPGVPVHVRRRGLRRLRRWRRGLHRKSATSRISLAPTMSMQGLEGRLERMVEGVFRRSRNSIRPIELGRRLIREMDDHRSVDVKGQRIVPNDFTVLLSAVRPRRLRRHRRRPAHRARRGRSRVRPRGGLPLHGARRRRAPGRQLAAQPATSASRRSSSSPSPASGPARS